MKNSSIHILWDSSSLWGLMAWRSLRLLGASPKLILAQKIAQGALLRKRPGILLVPGGSARQKALALGASGLEAIRKWLAAGGLYLGFCGGAGLALRQHNRQLGLEICPWRRMAYPDRLYHLVSGTLLGEANGKTLELPVWWPGRFAENQKEQLHILARYTAPGSDLWLADMPFMEAPQAIIDNWRKDGMLDVALSVKSGQPLIISGSYGAGRYILSYAHLETPAAADANVFLAELLNGYGSLELGKNFVPQWNLDLGCDNPHWGEEWALARSQIEKMLSVGKKLGLFFERKPWLLGWRRGAPGMACNNLVACLATAAPMEGSEKAVACWLRCKDQFMASIQEFCALASDWLWEWQFAQTLNADASKRKELENRRDAIFGHPMFGGGILSGPLAILEELIYLCLENQDSSNI